MSTKTQIHVLIAKEGDYWVAQCLEYDIGAQAREFDQVQTHVMATLMAEREESLRRHGKPFVGIDPAPAYFQDLWKRRARTFKPASPTILKNDIDIDVEFALAA